MKTALKITRNFPISPEELFKYFINKDLVRQWASPKGMSLELPIWDAREGGRYRYEYSSKMGIFECTGHFKEIIPNVKIVSADDEVKAPEGNVIFKDLESTVTFLDTHNSCSVQIVQSGFEHKKSMVQCMEGWEQSLDHLGALIDKKCFHPSYDLRMKQLDSGIL